MNKRYFIVATLSVLVLLTLAFFPTSTQQIREYNPWADINGDGKIDIKDIATTAIAYGSYGDPTRNVTVTNFPIQQPEPSWKILYIVENFNLTWTPSLDPSLAYSDLIGFGSMNISGYSRMKFYMSVTNYTWLYQGSPNQAWITCYFASVYDYGEISRGSFEVRWYWNTALQSIFRECPASDDPGYRMRECIEPSIRITIKGGSDTPNGPVLPLISCLVSIGIYLRNE